MNEKLRQAVFLRDNYECRNCGVKEWLIPHHIIPKRRGGKDELDNLIILCDKCHEMVHQGANAFIGFWVKHFREVIKSINKKNKNFQKKLGI